MRYLLSFVLFLPAIVSKAQTSKDIIAELRSINLSIAGRPCNTDTAAAISHRAMNVFLADKTGYLSAGTDLSFYTNYTTLSTAEGKCTVNHNFQKATGTDEPIRHLLSIGFDMTIAGDHAKSFLDNSGVNELGIAVHYTWLGKTKTRFSGCSPTPGIAGQKQNMDALRAALVEALALEINNKEADFEQSLKKTDSATIPGLKAGQAAAIARQNFFEDLKALYEEKFATGQAALLTKTANFKLISANWTSFAAYIPLYFPRYYFAPSFSTPFKSNRPFPLQLTLQHTRMWEHNRLGRLFFTFYGNLLLNNTRLSYGADKLNFSEYKSLGGTDTLHAADPAGHSLYIGSYHTFITPSLSARVVYFPHDSHIGISLLAEQNFGKHHFLNARLGIPVVLINSRKTPAVNIECDILFINIAGKGPVGGKSSLGLSVGIPFSRLMF